MKSLFIATLMFTFASIAIGQTVTLNGTGDQAGVGLSTNTGHITLFVTKGTDANGNPSTVLSFHIESRNADGTTTSAIGLGNIPDVAFTNQGPSKMNLNVDTSQVAGFRNTTCIFTPSPNFGFTCSPSQGGLVQIAWSANGISSDAETDHRQTTTGPVTEKTDGHGTFSSADSQGSVVGFAFSTTGSAFGAAVSSGHNHTITITQN